MWPILKATLQAWLADRASSKGAALAFYTIFSLAPLLIIVIAIVGAIYGQAAATGEVTRQATYFMGEKSASLLAGIISGAHNSGSGLIAGGIATITLLLTATTVFNELKQSLDEIWRVETRAVGIAEFLRTRLYAFFLILLGGILLLISLAISAGVTALNNRWGGQLVHTAYIAESANFVFSALVASVLFAGIYKFLPSAQVAWHEVWRGALFTALLFMLGKQVIAIYLAQSGADTAFGAAGSLVAILLWIYYSAQIFFFGAELTWVVSRRSSHSIAR